jgi:hypothetical protein
MEQWKEQGVTLVQWGPWEVVGAVGLLGRDLVHQALCVYGVFQLLFAGMIVVAAPSCRHRQALMRGLPDGMAL